MASTCTKGLWTWSQIWMLCFILSLVLQISTVAGSGSSIGSSCNVVTLEKLQESSCKLSQDVEVHYGNVKLDCGEVQSKKDVSEEPTFIYSQADKSKTYVLMMLDADAPNDGELFYRHWLVADIKGEDLATGNVKDGRIITEYTPPTPPQGTGQHHYQFFVLQQSDMIVGDPPKKSKGRFDAVDYCEDNGLCGPIASFEFVTKF